MSEDQELPSGWVWTTLAEAVTPIRESTHPSDHPALPYIGLEHVESETMRLLGSVPASEMKSNALYFHAGDVLYGRLRPYLNKVIRPSFVGLCSPEFIVFPGDAKIDPQYLQYFLNSWAFKEFATHLNTGDRPRIDWEQITVYPFPIAPLAEQRRIVAAMEQHFTRLDAGVAALKRAQATLKRYRASVLKAAVEGRLTAAWRAAHPDAEPASRLLARILAERRARWEADLRAKSKDPTKAQYPEPAAPDTASLPEVPKGWVWATVEQAITYLRNGLSQKPESEPTGHRILRINAVRPMVVNLNEVRYLQLDEEEVSAYFVTDGDLLFTRYNGSIELLGVAGMIRNCQIPTLHPDKLIRVKTALDGRLAPFMEIAVNVGFSRRHLAQRARTTAGQTGISGSDIKDTPIPLPPLAEQEQIVAEVERRLSVIGELEQSVAANLKRAERLRQSVLREAFAGRLVAQDAADEPASALLERIQRERAEREGHGSVRGQRVSAFGVTSSSP